MERVFDEAEKLLGKGEPFILATVVRTKGSTPQKPGAKLLIRRDGSTVGTLGGGCVEADIWAEARTILDENLGLQLRRFVLNEEIAAKDGLVCGGNMDILIDPIADQPEMEDYVHEILAAYHGQGDRALATLTSQGNGKLFIRADGSTVGSLGTPERDAKAVEAAIELMPKGQERWVESADGASIYVETFTNPTTVVIAGGGHVGKAIYTMAKFVGFKVIIVDDRPQFANEERFPDADEIVIDDFDKGLRGLNLTPNCYVIVATRGHKLDDVALAEAARSNAGYVGLLGSRRKAVMIFRDLLRQGISEERMRQIHAPVGLDLGGRTPDEIAVSIVAEIVAIKHGRHGGSMTLDQKFLDKAKQLASRPKPRQKVQAAL